METINYENVHEVMAKAGYVLRLEMPATVAGTGHEEIQVWKYEGEETEMDDSLLDCVIRWFSDGGFFIYRRVENETFLEITKSLIGIQ